MHPSQTAAGRSPTATMMLSGIYFDPYNPDPALVRLSDIAWGLDHLPRFGCQTTEMLMVGPHTRRVRRLALAIAPPGLAAKVGFTALHHDDMEVYTPWGDAKGPAKTAWMREVEDKIQDAIWTALGWRPTPEVAAIVKRADTLALFYEATLWQPRGHDWSPELIDVARPDMLRDLPLIMDRPGETWESVARQLRPFAPNPLPSAWDI